MIRGRPRPALHEGGEHRREDEGRNHCPHEHHRGKGCRQGKQRPWGVARLRRSENEVGGQGARHKARQEQPPRQIVHAQQHPLPSSSCAPHISKVFRRPVSSSSPAASPGRGLARRVSNTTSAGHRASCCTNYYYVSRLPRPQSAI